VSLNIALKRILEEYKDARGHSFAGNSMADFIRDQFPQAIREATVDSDRYLFEGSPGKGRWSSVPWGAVFDRLVTETAQEGYYLVYLFREDSSGVYLSLNQGVTTVRNQYGADTKQALRVRAADYLARIGNVDSSLITKPIDRKRLRPRC